MQESRKRLGSRIIKIAEGHALVTSTAERDVKGGGKKDSGAATAAPGSKGSAVRKRKASASKDEGQVASALRSVYQRAVEEDIPSEMLDLLKKLD